MDVQHAVTAELDEQVLARGLGAVHDGAVDQGGGVGEPALRARHRDPAATEGGVEVAGQPVEGVALRHAAGSRLIR